MRQLFFTLGIVMAITAGSATASAAFKNDEAGWEEAAEQVKAALAALKR